MFGIGGGGAVCIVKVIVGDDSGYQDKVWL